MADITQAVSEGMKLSEQQAMGMPLTDCNTSRLLNPVCET